MEQIRWADRVRNEVLYGVKQERNTPHTVKIRHLYWIGHNFCRSSLLNHAIEGKLEGKNRSDGKTRKKT